MKHISILVPESAVLESLEGTRRFFRQVNEFFNRKNLPPKFEVQLVGLSKQVKVGNGSFIVNVDTIISNSKKTDLIIIPSIEGEIQTVLEKNKKLIPWLVKQYNLGSEIASLCLGAFVLAQTGLIKNKKCATHWMEENLFGELFPDVQLVKEQIITDENGIYSCGSSYAYGNLIIYLIEKYAGRDSSKYVARVFGININEESQLPFTLFDGQKTHNDQQIKQAQIFIEENYHEKISIDQLATQLALGRRNFERRFKKATRNTIMEYMQRVKIEVVKKKLEAGNMNINEVMYDVGYSDKKAFRNIFKRTTGLSPLNYRKTYNTDELLN